MRKLGTLHPTDGIPLAPDYVNVIVTTAASSAYAIDYPTSLGSTQLKFIGFAKNVDFWVSYNSTTVQIPSTNVVNGNAFEMNPTMRQIPGGSTGFSIATASSGIVTISMYQV